MIDPLSLPGLLIKLVRSSRSSRKTSDSLALSCQEPENGELSALTGIARAEAMITVNIDSLGLRLDMIRATCFLSTTARSRRLLFKIGAHN